MRAPPASAASHTWHAASDNFTEMHRAAVVGSGGMSARARFYASMSGERSPATPGASLVRQQQASPHKVLPLLTLPKLWKRRRLSRLRCRGADFPRDGTVVRRR